MSGSLSSQVFVAIVRISLGLAACAASFCYILKCIWETLYQDLEWFRKDTTKGGAGRDKTVVVNSKQLSQQEI